MISYGRLLVSFADRLASNAAVTNLRNLLPPCAPSQAVMTSSVFVHDINAPVPLSEFFLPMRPELRFSQYQNCIEREELRWVDWWPDVPSPGNLSLLAGARG